MTNRRPLLSVIAVMYIGAIFFLSLARENSDRVTLVGEIAILVPIGVIFVLLLGNARWLGALLLSGMVCVWLELGRNAWFANRDSSNTDLGANLIGVVIGVAIGIAVSALMSVFSRERASRRAIRHAGGVASGGASGSDGTLAGVTTDDGPSTLSVHHD